MALVKFVAGTAAKYAALTSHDANTLYFLEDTHQLYKGDTAFTQLFEVVTTDPTVGDSGTAKRGVTYVNTTTGRVTYFNGSVLQEIVPAKGTSISGTGDNTHLATTKAVVDYVAAKSSADDVDALTKRVSTNEGNITTIQGQITTINGTGTGSIKKAASDAQAAAISAASSDATTKANNALTSAKSYADNLNTTMTTKVNGKADKATTLAGYGITNAFTKDETTTAINTAVANAHHLKREIVATLPAVASANADTIYMVPDSGKTDAAGSTSSSYKEYMLINGAFERIGTSDVDLSNYYTKTQVDTAIDGAKTAAANDASTKATNAKNDAIAAAKTETTNQIGALDVTDTAVSGQYVSAVSQTDGKITVTRAALPAAATLVEGTTNGTVKFNGSDVKVHGLGSAAFTASSAYATATQGTKADSALQKANIATGSSNGTIAVSGTDVAVKGLGSAAFTASTAYDAAGKAATAETNAKAYADTKKAEAVSAAATDATTKANNALSSAKSYTDTALTWGTL